MAHPIKTRVLILSDTHGHRLSRKPQVTGIDVVIHCGDLTEHSKLSEFRETIALLNEIEAPLKLIIPGNHDFSLDDVAFTRKMAEARRLAADESEMEWLLQREYGSIGDARTLLGDTDVVLLDEGRHSFTLHHGAWLQVYASPYTPSTDEWGFQYSGAHEFEMGEGVDIAITHGPPHGIMDMSRTKTRIGCPMLFRAVAEAKPRIHCFGHVHNGWGARLVAWRPSVVSEDVSEDLSKEVSHFSAINHSESRTVETLATLMGSAFETEEEAAERSDRLRRYRDQGCFHVDISSDGGDERWFATPGRETLFVNAAMKGDGDSLDQHPWLVDVDLPAAI
jgi:predicted phosphodiesterase